MTYKFDNVLPIPYILGPEKVRKMALLTIPLLRNIGLDNFFTYFILNIGVNGRNPITYIQTSFSTIVFQTTDGKNAYSPTLLDFCLFHSFFVSQK